MSALQKFGFRIRTRSGMVVDNLSVQARDRTEAERRIQQIYHYCEILECLEANPVQRAASGTADVEGVIALINDTTELPVSPVPGAIDKSTDR